MMYLLVKLYSMLYGFVKDLTGINLPGLGFALRQLHEDREISVYGRRLWFAHKASASYARAIGGSWNEPETHKFLHTVFDKLPGTITFVDAGANVGEILVDIAQHHNLASIIAFEPVREHCRAMRKSFELNHCVNSQIIQKLVGESAGLKLFAMDSNSQTSSIYSVESAESDKEIEMTTLDAELKVSSDHTILLVDVEGYEPKVLAGGVNFIRARQPLIIFEYNAVSKQHFNAGDVSKILGDRYRIYRLRQDGSLDTDVENAWNCVAVPMGTKFEEVCPYYPAK